VDAWVDGNADGSTGTPTERPTSTIHPVTKAAYRSYVIRAWTQGPDDAARVRVRIERVESGEQVDISGAAASRLATAVEAAIRGATRQMLTEEPSTSSWSEDAPRSPDPAEVP
jgi:hypothetical protein